MLFKRPKPLERKVILTPKARDGILSYCKMCYPDEAILILKGKHKRGQIRVDGLVIPPFVERGPTFAGFPQNLLAWDTGYVGVMHSHPVHSAEPSLEDLQNFDWLVSVIVRHPYEDGDIFAWDRSGNPIPVECEE